MSLKNTYDSIINQHKTQRGLSFGGMAPSIQRDNNIVNLEQTVLSKMFDALPEQKNDPVPKYQSEVRIVSVEDAIRELMEMEKNLNSNQ